VLAEGKSKKKAIFLLFLPDNPQKRPFLKLSWEDVRLNGDAAIHRNVSSAAMKRFILSDRTFHFPPAGLFRATAAPFSSAEHR